VGACVGMKGSRVQNIVQELRGEKIDIVNWDDDPARFVCNALAPAEISKVYVDEANKKMEIVVPDHQLSLAIGKKGQNVRLAAKLTTWGLDISSESASAQKTAESILNLMLIPGMNETMAQNIYQSGFNSFATLAAAEVEDVMGIPGYDDPERAQKLVGDAKALYDSYIAEGKPIPVVGAKPTGPGAGAVKEGGAQALAEARLKEELAQLKSEEAKAAAGETADSTVAKSES
jgi:transcription termination/antitermination protein NusA